MQAHTVEQRGPNALVVRFTGIRAGWEQWLMLSSDRHHDSPFCARDQERRHLDKAAERGALIVDAGDLYDAMQGKYDPRRNLDGVREEDKGENYLDLLVQHAAEFYGPYAEHLLLIGRGNHETSVRNKASTDLTERLVERINYQYGGDVYTGGYGGWVKFFFHIQGTKRKSCNLKYFHGKSGSAPVTKGVIQTNRQAAYLRNPDIVLNGHNHEGYIVPIEQEGLTNHGDIEYRKVLFVRTPGYKDVAHHRQGNLGYEAQYWSPRPIGCAWVRFFYEDGTVQWEPTLDVR